MSDKENQPPSSPPTLRVPLAKIPHSNLLRCMSGAQLGAFTQAVKRLEDSVEILATILEHVINATDPTDDDMSDGDYTEEE